MNVAVERTNERPYLLLTQRRTGGTSLADFLSSVSSFTSAQHEPFNRDRQFGDVTTSFLDRGNTESMEAAIRKYLETHPNIKHCYEIIPKPITEKLVSICQEQNYAVLHLTRHNEVERLRSLFLAEATGAWGREQADQLYSRLKQGETRLEPINLKRVAARFQTDRTMRSWVCAYLVANNVDWSELKFEDIYKDKTQTFLRVQEILKPLGLNVDEHHPAFIKFSKYNGQDSERAFDTLPNADEFNHFIKTLL